jgi:hypothetical protein
MSGLRKFGLHVGGIGVIGAQYVAVERDYNETILFLLLIRDAQEQFRLTYFVYVRHVTKLNPTMI